MRFMVTGINHHTASVAHREKVAFSDDSVKKMLKKLYSLDKVQEAFILSTCNRTEIYTYGSVTQETILSQIKLQITTKNALDKKYFYSYFDCDAIKHIMRVACGLDSMILGEPQILGQIKNAYNISSTIGTLKHNLEKILQSTFSIAKKVRTQTAIGQNAISIAFASVQLAGQIFTNLNEKTVLLIGAGDTTKLVLRHLIENGLNKVIVANRNLEKIAQIKCSNKLQSILLHEIPNVLHLADIVISSTSSQIPVLGKGAVENALKKRKNNPLLMIDLGVPRDIEPETGNLSDIYLYSVDDLNSVIQNNINSRQEAAFLAEQIIEQGVAKVVAKIREKTVVNILKSYRKKAELIKEHELKKALRQISSGKPLEQVLSQMANNLTNKLIHNPSVNIRKAGSSGNKSKVNWACELLGLDKTEETKNYETIDN